MAEATLSTDIWTESADPIVSLYSDEWVFTLTDHPEQTLGTDEWVFSSTEIGGSLPLYAPSIVATVARVSQNMSFPSFVIGGQGADGYGLFKKSSTHHFAVWRSPVYKIGTDFDVLEITLPLAFDIGAGMSITPKLYFDDSRFSSIGITVNSTNYTGNLIQISSKNFSNSVSGKDNFFLELQFTGSVLIVVNLPITIAIDIHDV